MKIKSFSVAFFFLQLASASYAENYNVLNVIGQIRLKATGKLLVRGDVIASDAQVVFMTKDAMAALFSPAKGRFTLKPGPAQTSGSEFLAFVKDSIIPSTSVLASRGDGPIRNELDFIKHFGEAPYLFLGVPKVEVSDEKFPSNEKTFFYLRYVWNGTEVNKKLQTIDGKLILDKSKILTVDEHPVKPEELSNFRFYFYNGNVMTSAFLCDFHPIFANEDSLKAEINILVKAMQSNHSENATIQSEAKSYLEEYYGKAEADNLSAWLKENFNL